MREAAAAALRTLKIRRRLEEGNHQDAIGPVPSEGFFTSCAEYLHHDSQHEDTNLTETDDGGHSTPGGAVVDGGHDSQVHHDLNTSQGEHNLNGTGSVVDSGHEPEEPTYGWMVDWTTCPLYVHNESVVSQYAGEGPDGPHGACMYECVMSIVDQCMQANMSLPTPLDVEELDLQIGVENALHACEQHLLHHEHEHVHEHEHEHMHRAPVWFVLLLLLIWGTALTLEMKAYMIVRRKKELKFTEAKLKGLVKHLEQGELRDMRKSVTDMEKAVQAAIKKATAAKTSKEEDKDVPHSPKAMHAMQYAGGMLEAGVGAGAGLVGSAGELAEGVLGAGVQAVEGVLGARMGHVANAGVEAGVAAVGAGAEGITNLAKLGSESTLKAFSFFFVDDTDPDTVREMGLDAAMYMCHMRLCGRYWLIQFCTTGLFTSLVYQLCGQSEEGGSWIDVYSWSYANLKPEYRWVSVVFAFWMTITLTAFVVYRQKQFVRLKQWGGHNEVRSGTTLWFEGVRPELSQRDIADWFHSHCPGKVEEVKVPLDVHELGRNVRAQRRVIIRMNRLHERLQPLRDKLDQMQNTLSYDELHAAAPIRLQKSESSMLKKLEAFQYQLDVLKPLEPGLRGKEFQPSGNVFVTFSSETAALSFRTKHLEGKIRGKLFGMDDLSDQFMQNGVGSWECQLAPMPAEIYWENMGLSKAERLLNEATGAALTGAVFMLFIGIACVAVFFISWDYFYYLYGLSATPGVQQLVASVKSTMTPFVFYTFGIGGFGGGLLVFEEFMSEIIEHFTGHERPVTQSRKQVSYSKKCYWFYIIFHLVLSTVAFYVMVVYFLQTTVPIRLYVDMCGLFHMNRALLTCAVVDPFHMLEGIGKFRRASKVQTDDERCAKTSAEDEEDMLYHAEQEAEHDEFFSDEFDYSKNYGETIAIFSTASYYATMHPLIMICASIYFYVKYVIDKYQVTRQYSKAPIQYGGRSRSTTHLLFNAALVGQIGNVFYWNWCDPDRAVGIGMWCSLIFAYFVRKAHEKGKRLLPASLRGKMKTKRLRLLQSMQGSVDFENAADPNRDSVRDFEFHPPKPEDMRVGVRLYYESEDDEGYEFESNGRRSMRARQRRTPKRSSNDQGQSDSRGMTMSVE